MSKTLSNLIATRPSIRFIDDERELGNSIIVTLPRRVLLHRRPRLRRPAASTPSQKLKR